jgi:hypothetical protein
MNQSFFLLTEAVKNIILSSRHLEDSRLCS